MKPSDLAGFRLLTPILVAICLGVISAIWSSVRDLNVTVTSVQIDVAALKQEMKDVVKHGRQ